MDNSKIIIVLLVLSLMLNMASVYMASNKDKDEEEDYAATNVRGGKGGTGNQSVRKAGRPILFR